MTNIKCKKLDCIHNEIETSSCINNEVEVNDCDCQSYVKKDCFNCHNQEDCEEYIKFRTKYKDFVGCDNWKDKTKWKKFSVHMVWTRQKAIDMIELFIGKDRKLIMCSDYELFNIGVKVGAWKDTGNPFKKPDTQSGLKDFMDLSGIEINK
jgi:hypothetical protein